MAAHRRGRCLLPEIMIDIPAVVRYNKAALRGAGPIRLRLGDTGALTREPDADHAVVGKGCLLLVPTAGPSVFSYTGGRKMNQKKGKSIVRLTESAMMIAIAALLSMAKLAKMPAGGSVTMASMLPIILIAYRYGTGWGLLTAFAYGVIQFGLGTDNIAWLPVRDFKSVATLIVADYLGAFVVLGFGGIFRKVCKRQATGLALGAVLVSALRYVCHVVSGFTVWNAFVVTKASLTYSLTYNATYMLPEMLILVYAAIFIGNAVDFREPGLTPLRKEEKTSPTFALLMAAGALITFALSFDTLKIFPNLVTEDGSFSTAGLKEVDWLLIAIVTLVCIAGAIALLIARRSIRKDEKAAQIPASTLREE